MTGANTVMRVRLCVGFGILAAAGVIEIVSWYHHFHSSEDSNAGCPGAAFTFWELVPYAILACWITAFVLLVVGAGAPKGQIGLRVMGLVVVAIGGLIVWALMRVGCLS